MSAGLKRLARERLPGIYGAFRAAWRRGVVAPRMRRLEQISAKIAAKYGMRVIGGPFEGMAYVPEAFCSGHAPKLLGSYEAELHGALEQIFARQYETIIDIGCAEGYYAVGMARSYPESIVYAYDIEETARNLCRDMAALNGVAERVVIRGLCDTDELTRLPLENALLLCDCEGCEIDLLQPGITPGLRNCDLLVELHDCFNPEITPTLLPRFAATHDIELISTQPRNPADYPAVTFLPHSEQIIALDDRRAFAMQWAVMTRKESRETE